MLILSLYIRPSLSVRLRRLKRPGLVALYDIRPGNRVGLFLQPGRNKKADALIK